MMTPKPTDDAPFLPQTVYDPNGSGRARPLIRIPGRAGSVRSEQSAVRSIHPNAHDSFRESYYPLEEPGRTHTSIHTSHTNSARSIRSPAPASLPPLLFRTQYPQVDDQPPSPSAASCYSQKPLAQPQPPQPNNKVIGHCHYEVCLDRGYFNNFIPVSATKPPERNRGVSWYTNNSAPNGSFKEIPENMSIMSSSRNLQSAQSNSPFLKGTSGFEKSVEDLSMGQRPKKLSLTTIFLAIVAVLFFLEECSMGAVWALYLSKQSNGESAFARGYFESKAMNFAGSAIGALVGLSIQWFLYPKLSQSRVALQLWSFILIFLTYMGCCIAAGMARRLQY